MRAQKLLYVFARRYLMISARMTVSVRELRTAVREWACWHFLMKIILLKSDTSHPDLDHQSDCLFCQIRLYLIKCLLQLELQRTCSTHHKISRI